MTVVSCTDADDLAATVAHQLRRSLSQLQGDQDRVVQVCLTGGRIANRMYQQLADGQGDNTVDWKRVEFWWGDERFVATESPDRNAGQTLALLAATIPLDPAKVHPMPAEGGLADLNQAAVQYATELGDTRFDICLLGMGPDGHVASVFPDHPSSAASGSVIGVTDSPKPPPERLSLTLSVINKSAEVWLIVAGDEKAPAAARAIAGDRDLPAGRVKGRLRTVWFVDQAAVPSR
ncbi:6-phosphogluconolactonase [Naumannella sp. ID2617S]|uniref:6-phosphogluconolactonase n=1 Tax=Enemella dayhoffiae TaxID=2016507 RepID=A0A255H621_9ACTN|nr:6-phosphogluconolactonase [Enemella dayhoffiae]NNG18645.1 6-phosphogluconolactonase [Naumannella sp. ID2617S]OYO23145.1 6-phosphogluconolactonase [Enemella dayhoffiae]